MRAATRCVLCVLCFFACEGVLADAGTTRALVPEPSSSGAKQPTEGGFDITSLLAHAEPSAPPLVVGGVALVGLAAIGMSIWNQGRRNDQGLGAQRSNPAASFVSRLRKSTPSDATLYGKCYERFDMDTQPGVCTGIHGDTAVTEAFANALRHETHMLAKGFAPQQARKGMLYAGLGIRKGLNDVLKHLLKRAQSQTAFECEAKGSACAADAVEETAIPASVGWDAGCVGHLVNDEAFGAQYGLQRRLWQVAYGFRNTQNKLFWGKNRLVGAAVVVCVGVALHGVGAQHELDQSNCACDVHKKVDDAEDYDCDDGIDTTCIIARYGPDSVKVQRVVDLERDLEEDPLVDLGPVTMNGKPSDHNQDTDQEIVEKREDQDTDHDIDPGTDQAIVEKSADQDTDQDTDRDTNQEIPEKRADHGTDQDTDPEKHADQDTDHDTDPDTDPEIVEKRADQDTDQDTDPEIVEKRADHDTDQDTDPEIAERREDQDIDPDTDQAIVEKHADQDTDQDTDPEDANLAGAAKVADKSKTPEPDAFEPGFKEYTISLENPHKVGRTSAGLWKPHASPEGGRDTIGYGHKMREGEALTDLTDAQVEALLDEDLVRSRNKAKRDFARMDTACSWDELDNRQRDMLTDYVFNIGTIRKFPKLVKAISSKDFDGMLAEFERKFVNAKGQVQPLEGRNTKFKDRFLSDRAEWE